MALTKQIDPTNGLIAYIQAIKPYHSKVLDVLVEYVMTDPVDVTIRDRLTIDVRQNIDANDKVPTYLCGYGNVWDPYGQLGEHELPSVELLEVRGYPSNEILVRYTPPPPTNVVVSNLKSNRFTMVDVFSIADVSSTNQEWIVHGNLTTHVGVGDRFYVSSNEKYANGGYTIDMIVYDDMSDVTFIRVREPVSLLAIGSGYVNVPKRPEDLRSWPASLGVKLKSNGTAPGNVDLDTMYYINPSSEMGVFNLLHTHIPSEYSDYVDVTDLGSGELLLERVEPFAIGDFIEVESTGVKFQFSVANVHPTDIPGQYLVTTNERINDYVAPTGKPVGSASLFGTYGSPACPPADVPPTFVVTNITERLIFQFTDSPEPIVIL